MIRIRFSIAIVIAMKIFNQDPVEFFPESYG